MTDEKPVADEPIADTKEITRERYGWLSLVVAGLFALFFAYDVWEAVDNLISLPRFYEASGLDPAGLPWWLLWIGVGVPVVVFVAAFIIGRHRNVGEKAVIFFVGLAVSSGLGLGVIALESIIRPTVLLIVV